MVMMSRPWRWWVHPQPLQTPPVVARIEPEPEPRRYFDWGLYRELIHDHPTWPDRVAYEVSDVDLRLDRLCLPGCPAYGLAWRERT